MSDELEKLLEDNGYELVEITGPLEPLVDIKEAIKDAPFHWP